MTRRSTRFYWAVLAAVVVSAAAGTKSASAQAVVVTIQQPASGSVIGNALEVATTVTSTFQVATVKASLDAVTANLVYTSGTSYAGTLDLSALPSGNKMLTVTATDVYGATGSASEPVVLDRPPSGVWPSLTDGIVATTTLRVRGRCVDEDPASCLLAFRLDTPSPVDVSSKAEIDTSVDVSGAPRGHYSIYLQSTDVHGKRSDSPLYCMWAADLTGLTEVGRARGTLRAFNATRFLYNDPVTPLWLADRASGATSHPFMSTLTFAGGCEARPQNGSVINGYVGDESVAFYVQTLSSEIWYASSASSGSVPVIMYTPVQFRRDKAAYRSLVLGGAAILDMKTGTEQRIPNAGAPTISPSGRVFAAGPGGIFEWTPSSNTSIAAGPCASLDSDDVNLVCVNPDILRVIDLASKSETSLVTPDGARFAMQDGWIAFQRAAEAGPAQVWTRSPTGTIEQVGFFGAPSWIEALSADGHVAVRVETSPPARWIVKAGSAPTQISPSGSIVWRSGQFYLMIGRSLYRLTSSCAPGESECSWVPPPDEPLDGGPRDTEAGPGGPAADGAGDVRDAIGDSAADVPDVTGDAQRGSGDAGAGDADSAGGEMEGGPGGSGGAGSGSGGGSLGGNAGSAGGSLGGNAGSAGATADASTSEGSPPSEPDCGCRMIRAERASTYAWLVATAGWTLAHRRRRRGHRHESRLSVD